MVPLEAIGAAIKEIDTKKENLRRAYDDLQAHYSSLPSSFSLDWSDLDAHFTHIQNSLTDRFRLLQSLESTQSESSNKTQLDYSIPLKDPPTFSNPPNDDRVNSVQDPCSDNRPSLERVGGGLSFPVAEMSTQLRDRAETSLSEKMLSHNRVDSVVARPELKVLCEKMDGKGLIKYINEHPREREAIRVELPGAFSVALDPGLMVLDVIEGFYGANTDSKGDIRRSCVLLLEVLIGIHASIGSEVRERAKRLALEWKEKVSLNVEGSLEALGFLHLVAAYGLGCEFEKNDLVEYFVVVARNRQCALLCKAVGLGDKVEDLIKKLIARGKQLLAVKYIFEFELTDKYPPVPLLKTYCNESKRIAKKVRRDGKNSLKSQNEATAKELSALKAVIKVIEEHKLESEYPKDVLEKRVEQLEKHKADRKRPAAAPAAKPQQQQRKLQQNGNKQPRIAASVGHAPPSVAGPNLTVPPFQQPQIQPAGLLPESSAYLNSAVRPFSLMGSNPVVPSYAGSSVGLYGLTRTPMGFPGNSNHATSHLYTSAPHMPFGYDRSTAYGGYGLPPQYHPSYYPQ